VYRPWAVGQGPLGLWLLGEVDCPGRVEGRAAPVEPEDIPEVDVALGLLVSPGLTLSADRRPFIPLVSDAGPRPLVSVFREESATAPESVTPPTPVSAPTRPGRCVVSTPPAPV